MRAVYVTLAADIVVIYDDRLSEFSKALFAIGGRWLFRRRNTGGVQVPHGIPMTAVHRLPHMIRVTGFETSSGNPKWILR